MAFKLIVKEIERLSQEEGLIDSEIAEKIGCSRATVNRIRAKENIPTANLMKKKDKAFICRNCGKKDFVRRYQAKPVLCVNCRVGVIVDEQP